MRLPIIPVILIVCATPGCGQHPPILDRELFFGDPEFSGATISPDGRSVTFLKQFKGVLNIWIKRTAEPFSSARPITADTIRPVRSYVWTRDSRHILYIQDKEGDENFHIYAVDPEAAGTSVPTARDLTPLANVRAEIIDLPRTTPGQIIVGLNDRRADMHDAFRLDIATGKKILLWKNDQNVARWTTDPTGELRTGIRQSADGGWELLRIDGEKLVPFYSVTADEDVSPERFTPDGKRLYIVTNKGVDKTELQLCDVQTGDATTVDKDPENEVDFGRALFSEINDELLATFYDGDRKRIYPRQEQFSRDWKKMTDLLPKGETSISSMTSDETKWIVSVSSDVNPGSRYLYDRRTGTAELLYHSRPNLPSDQLAPMKPVTYEARDGMTIHAYLVTPREGPSTDLPTVVFPHGGPWGRDYWGYNPWAQFLANRGYAVFMPNFRASTGYGKRYLNAGNKQWGTGSMQDDITDGVFYLIRERIADMRRIGIFGASYGGYATLAGVAFTPDLYAAGVSYVGPSNLVTLLKSIPAYWGPTKRSLAVRVGDIENPEDLKMLEKQSPLNSAKNIKAPLLVIQGANDPRVKKSESDQIVVAMRDLGRTVAYMVAPDEGHGFLGRENRLAACTEIETFLATHLKGRRQENVPPDIQKKIDALMVDITKVKLP